MMLQQAIPKYLKSDPLLYAGFIQLFQRGTVRVLEETPDGVFVQDTHGVSYMLATSDVSLAKEWLKAHQDETYGLMMAMGEDVAGAARDMIGLKDGMTVYQAVYEPEIPPLLAPRLNMVPATEKDVDFIRRHYANLDDEELQQVVRYRQLYMGYNEDGSCIGFVGQHMEGSMGLLEVLPSFRRKGYGAEMESCMIAGMLNKGYIPYCQFETDNLVSRALQEKLGMTILDTPIYWLF